MKKLKKNIKKHLYKKGYKISNIKSFSFIENILNKLIHKNKNLKFIQIGGNDGVNFDPLYYFLMWNKDRVQGIILEPVEEYFLELEKNYKDAPNIKALKLAIHNTESEMIIHKVDPGATEKLPSYSKGVASFFSEHHINCKIPSEFMIEEKVSCTSLQDLIEKQGMKEIDLLQIDTEGYDSEIILNIDFDKIKPLIISFEYYVPNTMSKETLDEILSVLKDNGYEIWLEETDIIAYQRDLFIKI